MNVHIVTVETHYYYDPRRSHLPLVNRSTHFVYGLDFDRKFSMLLRLLRRLRDAGLEPYDRCRGWRIYRLDTVLAQWGDIPS